MSSSIVWCAASSLLLPLLDPARPTRAIAEVARTRLSVHYETGREDVPVLCLCLPEAVRLPGSLVAPMLPRGPVLVQAGGLSSGAALWRVARWWQPPRPRGLTPPGVVPTVPGVPGFRHLDPQRLLGAGPGLTPSGDDVLAGALVAAHATADPRLDVWRDSTRAALGARDTTAVSRGMLHHALDGWATPELADFVSAVCTGRPADTTARLLAVGHTSGAALAAGALHVLGTAPSARAAAA